MYAAICGSPGTEGRKKELLSRAQAGTRGRAEGRLPQALSSSSSCAQDHVTIFRLSSAVRSSTMSKAL